MTRLIHRSIWIISLLSILLSLVGCSGPSSPSSGESATPTPIPTAIVPLKPTYTVQRGEILDVMEFTGRVSPVVEQELFFRTNGYVRKTYTKTDEMVKKGQVLADLEGIDDLERQLALNQLNVRRAEINVDNAQQRLDLFKETTHKWVTGYAHELAVQENELELAKIALEEASLNLQDLQEAISDTQIVAPFDGELLSFNVTEGRPVEGYKPVAVIANLNDLEISADLANTELQRLEAGLPVTTELFWAPGETTEGTIRRLPYPYGGGSSTISDTDTSTRISLKVPPAQAGMQLGDLVNVTVVLQRKDGGLWLPPQAIRKFSGRNFVVVLKDGVQQRVDVMLGIEGNERVEILEGLNEGDVVIGP